ncbi:MAG: helix-turn-helix domain-containing protein [Pseudomonadales bacterium]|nr:helix-turn-helix domain-containing protein [Pseudomonadales bacterium]
MAAKKPRKKKDWHRADIVAALHKAGWSTRRLSLHHGYASPNSLCRALAGPWPKAQRLIAEAIGVPPEKIWPSRYPDTNSAEQLAKRRTA